MMKARFYFVLFSLVNGSSNQSIVKPKQGFVDRAVGATDYEGCRNAEAAYNMDHSIQYLDCNNGECNIKCNRKDHIPTIPKIKCKNPRKNRWVPTPKKYGHVSCAPSNEQTKCGPITKHFDVGKNVAVNCIKDKCEGGFINRYLTDNKTGIIGPSHSDQEFCPFKVQK